MDGEVDVEECRPLMLLCGLERIIVESYITHLDAPVFYLHDRVWRVDDVWLFVNDFGHAFCRGCALCEHDKDHG